ncbi:MAG TPA: hypothetical protein VGX76_09850, partial [Pirellulales bacterium]|nr:hypothetical protein [Pirellulales bacterium]
KLRKWGRIVRLHFFPGSTRPVQLRHLSQHLARPSLGPELDLPSPLEIGLHALKAVPLEKGGRGKKGGLSEYAEKLGKHKDTLSGLRQAAEVYEHCKASVQSDSLIDRAAHLAAIHQADQACWPVLVEALLKGEWSAADTAAIVRDFSRMAHRSRGTHGIGKRTQPQPALVRLGQTRPAGPQSYAVGAQLLVGCDAPRSPAAPDSCRGSVAAIFQ